MPPPPPPPPPPRGLRPTVSRGGSWRPEPRGRPPRVREMPKRRSGCDAGPATAAAADHPLWGGGGRRRWRLPEQNRGRFGRKGVFCDRERVTWAFVGRVGRWARWTAGPCLRSEGCWDPTQGAPYPVRTPTQSYPPSPCPSKGALVFVFIRDRPSRTALVGRRLPAPPPPPRRQSMAQRMFTRRRLRVKCSCVCTTGQTSDGRIARRTDICAACSALGASPSPCARALGGRGHQRHFFGVC